MQVGLKFIIHSVLLFLLLGFWSCSEENDLVNDVVDLDSEIQKVETTLNEGETKVENFEGEPKNETLLDNQLVDKIRLELQKSYSKQKSYLKSANNLVGVIKNGSCGSYPELSIYMDCEDSRSASKKSGWTGSSEVTGAKNIRLKFCVVNDAYFQKNYNDYAILRVTSHYIPGVHVIERYFDNEDSRNANSASYNGKSVDGWLDGGPIYIGNDTRLSFLYFPKEFGSSWPSLGISYGVIGYFGAYNEKGYIHSDDEDHNNANWCFMDKWNGNSWDYQRTGSIEDVLHVGKNTKIFMSKVK